MKHFRPRFPGTSDSSLSKASSLFAAFAFQKGSVDKQPPAGGTPDALTQSLLSQCIFCIMAVHGSFSTC